MGDCDANQKPSANPVQCSLDDCPAPLDCVETIFANGSGKLLVHSGAAEFAKGAALDGQLKCAATYEIDSAITKVSCTASGQWQKANGTLIDTANTDLCKAI